MLRALPATALLPLVLLSGGITLIATGACRDDITDFCYVGIDCPGGGGSGGAGGGSGGLGGSGGGMCPPAPEPGCSEAICACPNTSAPLSPEPHCYGLIGTRDWPQPSGFEQIDALAVTAGDEIIMVGHYGGSFDLGGGSPSVDAGASMEELWVGSLSSTLQPQWHIGSSSNQSGAEFGATGTGANAHIAMATAPGAPGAQTAVIFTSVIGNHTLAGTAIDAIGNKDCVLIQLDTDGSVLNTVHLHTAGDYCDANGISATDDALYIAGQFRGAMSFQPQAPAGADGCDTIPYEGSDDGFLVKLDHNLVPQWCRRFGGQASDNAYAVAATGDGGAVVGGSFSESLAINGDLFTADYLDAIVLSYDSAGSLRWGFSFGDENFGMSRQEVRALAGTDDAIFVAGSYRGNISIDGEGYAGSDAIFNMAVMRLDLAGNLEWVRAFEGADDDEIYRISTDASNLHLLGTVYGDIDLHQTPPILQLVEDSYDGILLSLDQQCGQTMAARLMPGPNGQFPTALDLLADGSLVVGTTYDGPSEWAAGAPLEHTTNDYDFAVGLFQP